MIDLKKELTKRKLTLRAFAPLCGISFQQLGLYRNGTYNPSLKNEERIREALKVYDEKKRNK